MSIGKKCFIVKASARAKQHVRCITDKGRGKPGNVDPQEKTQKGSASGGGGSKIDDTPKMRSSSNYDEATKLAKAAVNSKEDAAIINKYSGTAYISWNNCKRKQKMCPPDTTELDRLDQILDNAPKFQGETYRGISFSNKADFDNILTQAKKGSVFTDKGFMSTSAKPTIANDFQYSDFNITFKINSKRGVAIKEFSSLQFEEEVLFKSNTSFLVKNVKKTSGNKVEIELIDP